MKKDCQTKNGTAGPPGFPAATHRGSVRPWCTIFAPAHVATKSSRRSPFMGGRLTDGMQGCSAALAGRSQVLPGGRRPRRDVAVRIRPGWECRPLWPEERLH